MGLLKQIELGYSISTTGRVYSPINLEMTLQKHTGGYLKVVLWDRVTRKRFNRFVHRLVAQAFIPNPNGHRYVNHKDGDKKNNKLDNLEWVSPKENTAHAYSMGLAKSGEDSTSSKITQDQVDNMRTIYVKGKITYAELALQYGISKQQVERIINKKRWKQS